MSEDRETLEIRQAREEWEEGSLKRELENAGERKKDFRTTSGIPIKGLYTPVDLKDRNWTYLGKLGFPGEYPFTRGKSPTMYRGDFWRMYQYAGYGSPEASNKWYKYVMEQGAQELGVALDLPTQNGYDSDHLLCRGEVGKVGVAINSLADMETMFEGIPIEKVFISTVASAIGPIFLAWMIALAEKRGIPPQKLRISIQGDILREIVARGTYIFPVKPSVKITCDFIEYAVRNKLELENAYCGYHIREAGSDAIQEMTFTIANAMEYIRELIRRGVGVDEIPRPRILLVAGLDFFEEICKFRAFRRMWARILKEKFNAKDPRSMIFSYHSGSQSSLYTAQQPLNNIIRGTIAAMVQALAGSQISSVARYDEALSLSTPESVRVALRTQQIVAYETGVADTVDPLAGSYYVEMLTDELEQRATQLLEKVEAMGGAIPAIEQGFVEKEIAKSGYEDLKRIDSGEKVRVGVNKFQVDEPATLKLMKVDPAEGERQIQNVKSLKMKRDGRDVKNRLDEVKGAAREGTNLVPPILSAVKAYATVGEICDALRDVFGEYKRPRY